VIPFDTRVIVLYKNRKLYDKESGEYVDLDTLRTYVKSNILFIVIDNATKLDCTKRILTAIISKSQEQPDTIPSMDTLLQVIKHKDGAWTSYMDKYLPKL